MTVSDTKGAVLALVPVLVPVVVLVVVLILALVEIKISSSDPLESLLLKGFLLVSEGVLFFGGGGRIGILLSAMHVFSESKIE